MIHATEITPAGYTRHPNGGGFVHTTATVHPSAYVGPLATVNAYARVGAACVIGDNATVCDGAILFACSRVESRAVVKSRTFLGAFDVEQATGLRLENLDGRNQSHGEHLAELVESGNRQAARMNRAAGGTTAADRQNRALATEQDC